MNADLIFPDWPAPPQVRAVATTRLGGRSGGPYASLNLGDHVGDDPAAVAANRASLRQRLPELQEEPQWLVQVHGNRCVSLDADAQREADASISRRPGRVCAILTADCLPLLFCNRAGSAVAAAHAGWRGLAGGVIEATVRAMAQPADELLVWLGPAIGPAAFEVGEEVRRAFIAVDPAAEACFAAGLPGKWWCDLYGLARQRLAALGVTAVYGGDYCTWSEPAKFFSYRRDGATGRMASLIWLAP